jgi:hypothetical protein
VCFTANLQEYIDHNARSGYVYQMQDWFIDMYVVVIGAEVSSSVCVCVSVH